MNISKYVFLLIIFVSIFPLNAQITLAIADFKNNTDTFFIDPWEQTIPEYLKSELSMSEGIVVVERRQLESVLKEQALSMTGLVDSSTAQKVGDLLGAEFVISGTISQSGKWLRIDAKIIRVSTGQVKSEKVRAPDDKYLSEMVSLLGNNIRFILSGEGVYQEKKTLEKYPTGYFLAATGVLTIGTLIVNNAYNKKLDEYHNATGLDQFDDAYDSANNLKKARTVLISITGAALIGSIYCWIQNLSPDEVLALNSNQSPAFFPNLSLDAKGNIHASFRIYF